MLVHFGDISDAQSRLDFLHKCFKRPFQFFLNPRIYVWTETCQECINHFSNGKRFYRGGGVYVNFLRPLLVIEKLPQQKSIALVLLIPRKVIVIAKTSDHNS